MQNVTGNETLAAPIYGENPTSLYPQLDVMQNPRPISPNMFESLANNTSVFHSPRNGPLNSIVSTHRSAPSTSRAFLNNNFKAIAPCTATTFLNNTVNRNAPTTLNDGNVPNSNGNAALPPPEFFCNFTKKPQKILKSGEKPENKNINTYLLNLSNRFSSLILCKLSSIFSVH